MTLPKISEGEVKRQCKFTVYMTPVAKARPRSRVAGDKVITYTPTKTKEAEWQVRLAIAKQVAEHPHMLFGTIVPIRIETTFYLPKPKSMPKKRTMPTTRPDLDNYMKLLQDALEGYLYFNDSQITSAHIKKRYGEPARIEVSIERDTEELQEVVG